jgi:hypothetical protein
MPAESKIERAVCSFVEDELKGLAYKFTSPGRRGVPDRLIILPGVSPFFIEFKAPNEKPRPQQIREIKRLRDRGSTVIVIDSVVTGKEVVQAMASLA